MRSREILIAGIALIVGLAGGFFLANSLNRNAVNAGPAQSAPQETTVSVPADGMQADVTATLEAANAEPQNFAAQMKAGEMYSRIGRHEKAIEFFKRGVLINPSNFQANVTLANSLFDSQRFEEAEQYYARALQIEPNDADARTDLGATFVERAAPDYQRAIAEFRQVRAAHPEHLPSLYYLGIATLRSGDKKGAENLLAELEKKGANGGLAVRLRQNIEAFQTTQ